jgi:hypothetical protein
VEARAPLHFYDKEVPMIALTILAAVALVWLVCLGLCRSAKEQDRQLGYEPWDEEASSRPFVQQVWQAPTAEKRT